MTAKRNPLLTKSESLSESWKARLDYTDGLAGTKFHNTWRAIIFTVNGKRIGCDERWKIFLNFKNDMYSSYEEGKRISRIDKYKPFSKENCTWVLPADLTNKKLIQFEYGGEVKPLKQWCLDLDLNYTGVKQRYHKGKNYTPHEILFGKEIKKKKDVLCQNALDGLKLRSKASKMISQYKMKDRKRGFEPDARLTIEWFIENIFKSYCVYCSTKNKLGADRIENNLPHSLCNIVPCCYRCNTMRQNHFTFDEMIKIGNFIKTNIDIRR